MHSYGPPHMAVQKQDDQHEHTFSNYVRIQDVVQKTCQRRWTIGKSGERGSVISVLPARHDDDDDDNQFDMLSVSLFCFNGIFFKIWSRVTNFVPNSNWKVCSIKTTRVLHPMRIEHSIAVNTWLILLLSVTQRWDIHAVASSVRKLLWSEL